MARILAIDVGISTGFALVDTNKFPNGGVIEEGTLKICELIHLDTFKMEDPYLTTIAEMPLQMGHAGDLYLQLRTASDAVRAYAKPDLEITASHWKRYKLIADAVLPPIGEGVTRTKHSKDALRIALWYMRIYVRIYGRKQNDEAL